MRLRSKIHDSRIERAPQGEWRTWIPVSLVWISLLLATSALAEDPFLRRTATVTVVEEVGELRVRARIDTLVGDGVVVEVVVAGAAVIVVFGGGVGVGAGVVVGVGVVCYCLL